jgi:hypothetical protein
MLARIALAAAMSLFATGVAADPPRGAPSRAALQRAPQPAAAPLKTIEFNIDPKFTSREREAIEKAMEEWNESLNGWVLMKSVIGQEGVMPAAVFARRDSVYERQSTMWAIRKTDRHHPMLGGGQDEVTLAFCTRAHGNFMYVRGDNYMRRIDLYAVILHEVGHVLDVDHDEGGALMAARYIPRVQQCIDEKTARVVAAKHGLSADNMVWCLNVDTPR